MFSAKLDYPRTAVCLSEFAKAQPARPLSSLFLFLKKTKHVRIKLQLPPSKSSSNILRVERATSQVIWLGTSIWLDGEGFLMA